jgi:hypothetical protein
MVSVGDHFLIAACEHDLSWFCCLGRTAAAFTHVFFVICALNVGQRGAESSTLFQVWNNLFVDTHLAISYDLDKVLTLLWRGKNAFG